MPSVSRSRGDKRSKKRVSRTERETLSSLAKRKSRPSSRKKVQSKRRGEERPPLRKKRPSRSEKKSRRHRRSRKYESESASSDASESETSLSASESESELEDRRKRGGRRVRRVKRVEESEAESDVSGSEESGASEASEAEKPTKRRSKREEHRGRDESSGEKERESGKDAKATAVVSGEDVMEGAEAAAEENAASGEKSMPRPDTLSGSAGSDYGSAYTELLEQLSARMAHRIMRFFNNLYVQTGGDENRMRAALVDIQKWNKSQIKDVARDFYKGSEDILRVFRFAYAADVLVMSSVTRRDKNSTDVEVTVPPFIEFVHRCFIRTAHSLYDQVYILSRDLSNSERMQAGEVFRGIVHRAIAYALRTMVPFHKLAAIHPDDEEQYDFLQSEEPILGMTEDEIREDGVKTTETVDDDFMGVGASRAVRASAGAGLDGVSDTEERAHSSHRSSKRKHRHEEEEDSASEEDELRDSGSDDSDLSSSEDDVSDLDSDDISGESDDSSGSEESEAESERPSSRRHRRRRDYDSDSSEDIDFV